MSAEKKFWPAEEDKHQLTARFHVPTSSLLDENRVPGTVEVVVTESPNDVDARLRSQFPIYGMVASIRSHLGLRASHEI